METIIDKEPQSGEMLIDNTINKTSTTISTTISNNIINTKDALKEELKKIPISERHQLLNSILLEERNEYIKKQKEEEKKKEEEEKKCSNCPLSKKIKIMNFEIQDLKIELQKSKNEMNDMKQTMKNNMKKECQLNTYTKKNKCPYSLFSLGSLGSLGCSLGSLDINTSTNKYPYNNDEENLDKFCEELTETYTSSFSWWFTIMFIVFMLFILTSKPIKPLKSINLCDSLFF